MVRAASEAAEAGGLVNVVDYALPRRRCGVDRGRWRRKSTGNGQSRGVRRWRRHRSDFLIKAVNKVDVVDLVIVAARVRVVDVGHEKVIVIA